MYHNLTVTSSVSDKVDNLRTKVGKEFAMLKSLGKKVEHMMESTVELEGILEEPETWKYAPYSSRSLFGASIAHPEALAAWNAIPAFDGTNGGEVRRALEELGSKLTAGSPWRDTDRSRLKSRAALEAMRAKAEAELAATNREEGEKEAARAAFFAAVPELPADCGHIVVLSGGEVDQGADYGGYAGRTEKVAGFYSGARTEAKLREAASLAGFDHAGERWSEYSHSIGGNPEIRYVPRKPYDFRKLDASKLRKVSASLWIFDN